MNRTNRSICSNYTSCFKVDGRPILPPVITKETREEIEQFRKAALEREAQRKEKKRAALLDKVTQILERCTTPSSVEKIELTRYKVINVPSFSTRVNQSLCLEESDSHQDSRRTVSLPSSPVSNRTFTEVLNENDKNAEPAARDLDQQISECSTLSTDLGPYMAVSRTTDSSQTTGTDSPETVSSQQTDDATPVPSSDSEGEGTAGNSTPVNPSRIRRLSYTLEAPSPVLLQHLQAKRTAENRNETSGTQIIHHSDMNGNNNTNSTNVIQDFITKQQQMMQQLLERQQREQQELEELFRSQEEELLRHLQQQNTSSRSSKSDDISTNSKRNLSATFEALPAQSFRRLPALVKGYLTRRLMKTDRVQTIVKTIRDTAQCLDELRKGSTVIIPSDLELHKRLVQQLNGAIESFHEVFFRLGINEQMEIISQDRLKRSQVSTTGRRQRSRSLSSATIKSLERKSRPGSAATVTSSVSSITQRSRKSVSSASTISSSLANYANGMKLVKKITLKDSGRKPWR